MSIYQTEAVVRRFLAEVGPFDKALTGAGAAGAGDIFNNKNPAYQIAFYVQHSGVAWGILTNGRLWRLVHKDTAHKLDRYYEVDLPAVIAGSASAAVRTIRPTPL
jgi:hypothetical protein